MTGGVKRSGFVLADFFTQKEAKTIKELTSSLPLINDQEQPNPETVTSTIVNITLELRELFSKIQQVSCETGKQDYENLEFTAKEIHLLEKYLHDIGREDLCTKFDSPLHLMMIGFVFGALSGFAIDFILLFFSLADKIFTDTKARIAILSFIFFPLCVVGSYHGYYLHHEKLKRLRNPEQTFPEQSDNEAFVVRPGAFIQEARRSLCSLAIPNNDEQRSALGC